MEKQQPEQLPKRQPQTANEGETSAEEQRLQSLKKLAWALFELADNESRKDRLVLLSRLVGEAKPLFDEAEDLLHPDLGLELMEFIDLKDDSLAPDVKKKIGLAESTARFRESALEILNSL